MRSTNDLVCTQLNQLAEDIISKCLHWHWLISYFSCGVWTSFSIQAFSLGKKRNSSSVRASAVGWLRLRKHYTWWENCPLRTTLARSSDLDYMYWGWWGCASDMKRGNKTIVGQNTRTRKTDATVRRAHPPRHIKLMITLILSGVFSFTLSICQP